MTPRASGAPASARLEEKSGGNSASNISLDAERPEAGDKKGSAEGRLDTDTTVGTEVLRQQRHDAKTNMDGVQNLPAHLQGEFMKTIEQMQTKDSLT